MALSDLPSSFDVVVLGTGLPESMVSAALSRIGKKVLHLDRNPYYGSNWATHSLKELIQWAEKHMEQNTDADLGPQEQEGDISNLGDVIRLGSEDHSVSNVKIVRYLKSASELQNDNAVQEKNGATMDSSDTEESVSSKDVESKEGEASQQEVEEDAEINGIKVEEQAASSAEQAASSTDQVASSTEQVASPTELVASSTEQVASSTEQVASSTEQAASSTEQATSSTEQAASPTEQAASSTEQATSSTEQVTSSTEQVASSTEQATSSTEQVASSTEQATSSTEQVASSTEQAASSTEQATSSTEQVASSTEQEATASTAAISSITIQAKIASGSSDLTIEDLISQSRKFNLDLAPKLLFARGAFVETLINANITHYAEFRTANRILTFRDNSIIDVPCSRSDVFGSMFVSVLEKRILMKFLTFCLGYQNNPTEYEEYKDKEFHEFLKSKKLSDKLQFFVTCAIAMVPKTVNTLVGLEATQKFLHSLGRYSNSPFLWPMYGIGELPQAFCRMSAVFGGMFCLRKSVQTITIDNNDENPLHLTCSEGEKISAKWIVMNQDYLPTTVTMAAKTYHSRAVVISNRSLKPSDDDNVTLLTLETEDDPVLVIEIGPASCGCPRGLFVVNLTCKTRTSAAEDLTSFVELLFNTSGSDHQEESKPNALWCIYFNQESTRTHENYRANGLPENIILTSYPDASLGVDHMIDESKGIFETICPGEEFLPAVPNPEDIIWDDVREGLENQGGFANQDGEGGQQEQSQQEQSQQEQSQDGESQQEQSQQEQSQQEQSQQEQSQQEQSQQEQSQQEQSQQEQSQQEQSHQEQSQQEQIQYEQSQQEQSQQEQSQYEQSQQEQGQQEQSQQEDNERGTVENSEDSLSENSQINTNENSSTEDRGFASLQEAQILQEPREFEEL